MSAIVCYTTEPRGWTDVSTWSFGRVLEWDGHLNDLLSLGRVPCEQLARLGDRLYGEGWPGEGKLRERIRAFGRAAFDAEIARRAAL